MTFNVIFTVACMLGGFVFLLATLHLIQLLPSKYSPLEITSSIAPIVDVPLKDYRRFTIKAIVDPVEEQIL